MRYVTVVVELEDGKAIPPVSIDTEVFGGRVTAMAAYDAISALEVAQDAVEECDREGCELAAERLQRIELNRED